MPGTGFTSTLRPQLTGAPIEDAPDGSYLNPAAYTLPASGQYGDAGRNSVTGPAQFGLNAAVGRTFRWGNRFNIDWRIDATNVLNRVTYAGVNTFVGSPQFGLAESCEPDAAPAEQPAREVLDHAASGRGRERVLR